MSLTTRLNIDAIEDGSIPLVKLEEEASLKNPHALTIQGNGTTIDSYDGSSAKTINITPASIGADSKPFSTIRDFINGTLIKTNIDYSVSNGVPFYVEIKGNTYFEIGSMFIQAQGYIYNDTIINYSVTSFGVIYPEQFIAINVDGYLCFWFPRIAYWHGYSVKVTTGYDYSTNCVVDVIDSVEPTGTKRVVLTDNYFINKGFNSTLKTTTLKYRDSDNQVVNAPIDPTYESLIDITGGLYYAKTTATATRVSNELTIHTPDGETIIYDGSQKKDITIPAGGGSGGGSSSGSVSLKPSWSNGVLTLTAVFGTTTTTTTTTSSTTTTSTTTTTTPSRSTVYVIEGTFSPIVVSPLMWTEDYNGNTLLLEDEELVVTYYKSDGTVITGNEMFPPGAAKYKITTTYNPSPTSTGLTAAKYLLVTGKATALTGAPSIGGKISILPSTNTVLWSTVDDGVNDIIKSATLNFGSTVLTTVEGTTTPKPGATLPPVGDTILYQYGVSFNTIGTTIPSSAITTAKLYSSRDVEIATTPIALGAGNTSGTANWTVRTTTSPGSTLKVKLYAYTHDGTLESNVLTINFTLNSSSDTEYRYSASNITFSMFEKSPSLANHDDGSESNNDDGSESNNDDTSSLDDVINEYMNEQ